MSPGGTPKAMAAVNADSSQHFSAENEFEVIVEQQADHVVLHVRGDLDLATASLLKRCLDAAQSESGNDIMLDLGDLTFIDSSGISLVIEAHRRAVAKGRCFSLRRVPRQA